MPAERRGRAIRAVIVLVNRQREEPTDHGGGRQPSMDGTSRVTGDCHARICESPGVKFPGATRPAASRPRDVCPRRDTPPPITGSQFVS